MATRRPDRTAMNSAPLEAGDAAEQLRLDALLALDALDSPREEAFERIARLVRNVFDLPVALVSVIDAHRQWYKSCDGLSADEVERKETFCRYTIAAREVVVVEDASRDPRFAANRHVVDQPFVRFYAGVPLATHDGLNVGTLCAVGYQPRSFSDRERKILVDLAEMAMDEFELRRLAAVDPLTGVLSRRAFTEQARDALALAKRLGHDLSLIVLDLDHFKRVNDSHGHAAGDKVLAATIDACLSTLRSTDAIGRLGGEEFGVLLRRTHPTGALEVAEKLRRAVSRLSIDIGARRIAVTASFGAATAVSGAGDYDTLMASADAALYRAKAAGRNRCLAAPSSAPPRRRVLKAGRILVEGGEPIACSVTTLGPAGAGLGVNDGTAVPDAFRLAIAADGFERACRVTVRAARHVEVEFG